MNHACVTNDLMTKVDNQLLKVSDLWTHTLKEFNKYEGEIDSNDIDTWKEFDSILKTLMEWVTVMREKIYGMEYKLSGSSIEMLKNSYSGILVGSLFGFSGKRNAGVFDMALFEFLKFS